MKQLRNLEGSFYSISVLECKCTNVYFTIIDGDKLKTVHIRVDVSFVGRGLCDIIFWRFIYWLGSWVKGRGDIHYFVHFVRAYSCTISLLQLICLISNNAPKHCKKVVWFHTYNKILQICIHFSITIIFATVHVCMV